MLKKFYIRAIALQFVEIFRFGSNVRTITNTIFECLYAFLSVKVTWWDPYPWTYNVHIPHPGKSPVIRKHHILAKAPELLHYD